MKRGAAKLFFSSILTGLVPWPINATSVSGLVPPPQMPSMERLVPTLTTPPISEIVLGKLIVRLEITTLGEVKKTAGVGEIQHTGDAGGSEDWLCYITSFQGRPERIWISSGELGGGKHVVGSFYAATSSKTRSPYCPRLPAQLRPVTLVKPLWIGSSLAQVKDLFGKPSMESDGWWLYSYRGKVPANGFDRLAILGVHVINGKVVGLFLSQATTN